MPKDVLMPMPQPQFDKLISKVVQPLPRHYNGQGLARPSEYIPLSSASFEDDFQSLWDEHVQFGTSRSHKKLLGKKRTREGAGLSAGASGSATEEVSTARSGKSDGAGSRGADGGERVGAKQPRREPSAGGAPGGASAPSDAAPMATKGRFSGTLAARLLGGGGAGPG